MYLYALELSMEKKKEHAMLGEKWKAQMGDVRFWIVLPGILDMLLILNGFNTATQPGSTTLERASEQLQLCIEKLEDNTLRTRSEANGQKPSKAVALILDFHENSHKKNVSENATQLEKVLAKMNDEVRKEKKTGAVTRLAVFPVKYTSKAKGEGRKHHTTEVVMPITSETLKESVSVLYAYGNCLMRELGRRHEGSVAQRTRFFSPWPWNLHGGMTSKSV